jgi:hypothetical protein
MVSRPASMRLAMAISPSRLSNSTEPISRRYMRTGSSVRSEPALVLDVVETAVPVAGAISWPWSSSSFSTSVSSTSSSSTTLMPMSENMDMKSSICSDETSSDGITALSSS